MTRELDRIEPTWDSGLLEEPGNGARTASIPNEISLAAPQHWAAFELWEKIVSWVVLLVGGVGLFGIAYAAGADWSVVFELVRRGAIPIWAFAIPLCYFVAAILLVARRKLALPLFVAHLPLAILYLASRNGLASISPLWWFGYLCEALVIWMCVRLWARGALR